MTNKRRLNAGARIAKNAFSPRTLPEFEEHRVGDHGPWQPGVWHPGYWRSDNSSNTGRYECLDCGGRHDLPNPELALVCPKLPDDEARSRAVGRIEKFIARATGQPFDISSDILWDIADEMAQWAEAYPWGAAVWAEYRHHHMLQPYISELDDPPQHDGDNVRPLPNAGEMIFQHLPLVARACSEITCGKGDYRTSTNIARDLGLNLREADELRLLGRAGLNCNECLRN